MMIGERDAFDFGVEVGKRRLIVFTTAAALVGISVRRAVRSATSV
jgi:ABC-type Fe3+-siderophore transport system permease subunit